MIKIFPITKESLIYRFSQFLSLLLGTRILSLLFITFSLYVTAFFLLNRGIDLQTVFLDYKIHGIILCSVLSIASGGIINQFYDKEKDRLAQPFRYKFQGFLKQKYFLFLYVVFNSCSLGIALLLSFKIFVFFLAYQFIIWLYSHKLSKILIVNNISHVIISLYPFFGMLVYYERISFKIFWMALFLFVLMLIIDIMKDLFTQTTDKTLGYITLPVFFGEKKTCLIIMSLLLINTIVSYLVLNSFIELTLLSYYFLLSAFLFLLIVFCALSTKINNVFWMSVFLKIWVFLGVVFMLLDGILEK